MNWNEYVVPMQVKKNGNSISCKIIVQFPEDDKSYLGNFLKGIFNSDVVVDFDGIKTKEQYLKDEKAWHDYVTYLKAKELNPEDYD